MGNLSSLISDAFTIYSESYAKIGELGSKVVDLNGSPSQPKKINQLIACTRLYRVIAPSIILNDAGDAIEWIVGDVATINNLLLRLKRCVGLYDVPAFPTPLTDFVFNLGSGGADVDATYVTVVSEGGLPQSRRLAIGAGLSLTDGGALGNVTLVNTNALDSVQVDTSVNPVLDLNGLVERLFYGSTPITGLRTWSLLSATNVKMAFVNFVISGLTPGAGTHDQTWPSSFKMSDARWNSGTKTWRPIEDGEYQAKITTYDGVNYKLEISDIFS